MYKAGTKCCSSLPLFYPTHSCALIPAKESFSQTIPFINDMDIIYLTSRRRTVKLCL